jgi:hypothetical protein
MNTEQSFSLESWILGYVKYNVDSDDLIRLLLNDAKNIERNVSLKTVPKEKK